MEKKTFRIPAIPGFTSCGIASGIKKDGSKDLALIVSRTAASAAGVFTQNQVQSPSVVWSRKAIKRSNACRAVLINSGNANACNGPAGMKDCETLTRQMAKELSFSPREILIASTGIIGKPLPVNIMLKALPMLKKKLSPNGWSDTARAIMTTDLVPKGYAVSYMQGRKKIVVGGIAKGSGMIHPNMATLLGFIQTNAKIDGRTLQMALLEATDQSFNRISVDRDTSTNDLVIVMANGLAENTPITSRGTGYNNFSKALNEVCKQLAFKIVADGEGATKFVTVRVQSARSREQARKIAISVATSPLVKTALFGEDPNWGRILSAVGYAGVPLKVERIEISLNGAMLFKNGKPAGRTSPAALAKKMKLKSILIIIDLHVGKHQDEIYTCDFSYDYIRINAEYTT